MMKTSRKMTSIFSVTLLKCCFDVFYVLVLNPVFQYEGYDANFSTFKMIESYLVLMLIASQVGDTLNAVNVSFHLFLSVLFVPLSTYYVYNEVKPYYYYCQVIAFLLCILVTKTSVNSNTEEVHGLRIKSLSENNIIYLMGLFVGINMVYLVVKGGIKNFNLDIRKVYVYRASITEQLYTGIFAYTLDWAARIFNPMLFVYYYRKESIKGILLTLAVQILFFGFLNGRSILFYPFLLVTLFIMSKKAKGCSFLYTVQISVLVFSILLFLIARNNLTVILIESLLRRAYFVPARLNFVYFEFFSKNPKIKFSNTFGLENLTKYPYSIHDTSHLIGDYLGKPNMAANTGIFATGYMQLGLMGLIIYSILLGLIIRLVGKVDQTKDNWIALSIFELNLLTLVSSDFPTSLLSHGLLMALLLYCISPDLSNLSKRTVTG